MAETQKRVTDQHRLKDAEKERQLAEMRRQIEDLKRKAEQGSQQLQGEAGEDAIELMLRTSFPCDDINPVGAGHPRRRHPPGRRSTRAARGRRHPVGVQEREELERRLDRRS